MRALWVGVFIIYGCAQAPATKLERGTTYAPLGPGEWPRQEHVMCPEGPCDLATNEGCEPGQLCSVTDFDPAVATLACYEASIDAVFCCTAGSREECGTNAICALPIGTQPPFIALACLETAECDPVSGTGCADDMGCVFSYGYGGFTFCAPVGAGGVGSACAARNDCQSGLVCTEDVVSEEVSCEKYCELSTNRGCSGSQTCRAFVEEPLKYGWCD